MCFRLNLGGAYRVMTPTVEPSALRCLMFLQAPGPAEENSQKDGLFS